MSQDKTLSRSGLLLRVLGAMAIVVSAGGIGALLGHLSAPNLIPKQASAPDPTEETEAGEADEMEAVLPALDPPLYLHLGIGPESVWEALDQEIAHAASSGLHQYIVPLGLPWAEGEKLASAVAHLERIIGVDPEATFLLELDCNPPESWFESHPGARMTGVAGDPALPSPASTVWRQACRESLDRLLEGLDSLELTPVISGYVLHALHQGWWQGGESADNAEDNTTGFREWLQRTYSDDGALQKAWHVNDVTLASAAPPAIPAPEEGASAFLGLDGDAPRIDYARYRAASVADAIGALASHLRERAGAEVSLWATYGYSFEMASTANGHLALQSLLDSDLDGFVAPVSLANRGIGGSGGYMGPIQSATAHGKQWIIVDDTRTGIAWNGETGQIDQIRGLRPEDVYNVQQRNFALAAVYGLGLAWSDPIGQGALCNETQWALLGTMMDIYRNDVDYPGSRLEMSHQTYPEDSPITNDPTLLVVVDEAAQFLTNDSAGLPALLTYNRDEILRAGVRTEFCLLDDFLDSRAPQAAIYLFLNAYSLPTETRARVHQRFTDELATVIWVYAPGYRDVTLMAGNISDTIGMKVKAFDEPTATGSTYTLGGGHWLDEGQAIGNARPFSPLFYIDDEETDVLAHYKQSEKPSVAMRTMEEGWTSIYLAEPELSAPLLRELLRILEQQVYFRPGKQRFFDVTVARNGFLAVHAGQVGERIVNLGQFYDIQDLFDESIGWPQKESFVLNLEQGETRLLKLSPL